MWKGLVIRFSREKLGRCVVTSFSCSAKKAWSNSPLQEFSSLNSPASQSTKSVRKAECVQTWTVTILRRSVQGKDPTPAASRCPEHRSFARSKWAEHLLKCSRQCLVFPNKGDPYQAIPFLKQKTDIFLENIKLLS